MTPEYATKLQQDGGAIAKAFALVAEHGQRSINRFKGLLEEHWVVVEVFVSSQCWWRILEAYRQEI